MCADKRISVITPVYGPKATYLREAYDSLAAQTMPAAWQWEWLIQQDGPDGDVAPHLPTDDPRISLRVSKRWGGQALARNLALSRASGQLVKVLDADDMLRPGLRLSPGLTTRRA